MRSLCSATVAICLLLSFLVGCDRGGGGTGATAPADPSAPFSISSPARVASFDPGSLIVSDYLDNEFCLVDKSTLAVSSCFKAKGQPTGVAYVDYLGGRYFVGNKSVRSVDIFDNQGTFLGHLGGKTGLFEQVSDLAVDEVSGFVYVLDSKSARIDAYDFEGNLAVFDWSSGGLNRPTAIEFYDNGNFGLLFVSDFGDLGDISTTADDILPRIKIYDLSDVFGTLADEIVADETPPVFPSFFSSQSFSSPQGTDVYNGHLFVAESSAGEIQVFDLATKGLVKVIGVRGTGEGELYYPLDVQVDDLTADVFVSDYRNGRVVVYRGEGEVP